MEILATVLIPVCTSLIVGFGAAWLASQKAMATFGVRLNRVEQIVEQMESRERDDSDRLTRVETKLDVLIGLWKPSLPESLPSS